MHFSDHLGACAGARTFALPGSHPVYERARPFLVRHLSADLTLDVARKRVKGIVEVSLERVDADATEVELDAVGFDFASVEVLEAGSRFAPVAYAYDGARLRLSISSQAAEAKVRLTYEASPRRGLYFLEPDAHVPDRPRQVWTQCQDEDARHFLPCHDKPHVRMTFALVARVPKGWFALSNGELVEKDCEENDEVWTYRWDMSAPLPSYLLSLVAGEFSQLEGGSVGAVPVRYYVPKGREEDGRRTFARTPEMISHFGELLGTPFPFAKYSQIVVSDFTFGGMENTTATTLYEHALLDERARLDVTSDDLIAHELAHQWFGDFVTCRDWNHGWLNEGFATFMETVDRGAHLGEDERVHAVQALLDRYLSEASEHYRRPIVCRTYENPIDLFDRHLYEKAGFVLHMLREELGDAMFWRGVRAYLHRHGGQSVETRDLLRALEDASGRSLELFFDQWVYRAGHPELAIAVEHKDGILSVSVDQKQKVSEDAPAFHFDFALDEHRPTGAPVRHVLRVRGTSERFALRCPDRPRFVVVDPNARLLAELDLDVPVDWAKAQLAEAPTARGRALAIGPIGRRPDDAGIAALARTLGDEAEFWGTRARAAEALGKMRLPEASRLLLEHVETRHPKVRRAVVRALGEARSEEAARALVSRALTDPSYLVQADAARSLGRTRQASVAFDTLLEVLDRPSWAEVVRVGALAGLAELRDERALGHLVARIRYGVPRRARQAAMLGLARLTRERPYREALEDVLSTERDPHTRGAAASALAEMGDPKSRAALLASLEREDDGRSRRQIREALARLEAQADDRLRDLRDDLDRLRASQGELALEVRRLSAALGAREPSPPPTPERSPAPRPKRPPGSPAVKPATSASRAGRETPPRTKRARRS